MALVPARSPDQMTSTNAPSDAHIRSIELKFKTRRNKYPISIEASFGEKKEKSKQYKKNEGVHWLCESQLAFGSQLAIVVREHHSLRRTIDKITVRVLGSDLVTKLFSEVNTSDADPISVTIHCGSIGPFIDVIRRLVEQSQSQLKTMKVFLDKFGRACEVLNCLVTITEAVSSVHPAAESAASIATSLLELCQKLQECHTSACELMEEVSTFLLFTDVPESGLKCNVTAQTLEEMLDLFGKICRAIIKYSNGSVLGILLKDQGDEICSFKEQFKRLKETFGWCLTTEIWKTTLKIEENTDILLLKSLLSPVTEAFYNENKLCFEGSRKDTLQAIKSWAKSESSPNIFWLHGPTGLGKTAIAHTVGKLFHEQNRLAGCIFPSDRQNSDCIMPTIAYHMAGWHGDYHKYILDVLRGPRKVEVGTGLAGQFELLMRRPLVEINLCSPPIHKPLIVVLDALENCFDTEGSRRSFVDFVVDIASLVPWLKVFVSSRKSDVFEVFRQIGVRELDFDDPMLDLHHDIITYTRLCSDHQKLHSQWTPGMEDDVRRLFTRICGSLRVSIRSITEAEGFNDNHIVQTILAATAYLDSIGPLTKDVLFQFLQSTKLNISRGCLRSILSRLSPIIGSNGNPIQISFPLDIYTKFLSEDPCSENFLPEILKVIRGDVALYSLDSFRTELKFNICGLGDPQLRNEDVPEIDGRVNVHISGKLRLFYLSWMDSSAQSGDIESYTEAVAKFLCSRKALFWLEILSLLGELDAGREILSGCMNQFKEDDRSHRAAKELHAFVSHFEPAIKLSAPHLYISALMWLPSDSPIVTGLARGLSLKLSVTFEKLVEAAWNAVRMGSRGRIFCITRSPDGSRIISGSTDRTLEIWDGWTGERIGEPIKGHSDYIRDIKYSSNGTKFVSGSWDETVKIWDAWTGRLVKELKSGSDVEAVAYSPDGSRVVSGHGDGRIRIWDAHKGALIAESPGRHRYFVSSVAYSPDGRRVVSDSRENTVRIWDAESGAAVGEPLIGHKDNVNSVSYSPDGSRIVSGSDDETVRIWDARTGTPVGEPLKGHEDEVTDVGYSQDGETIMSASGDETIRFWNATDGTPTGVLRRGESRWDPVRRHFVSNPKWWPVSSWKSFNLQSLIYSSNPLYVPDDGWIRTLDGGLLLWVPPEHRACSCHAASESTLTGNPCDERLKKSEWEDIPQGTDWAKMMNVEELDGD